MNSQTPTIESLRDRLAALDAEREIVVRLIGALEDYSRLALPGGDVGQAGAAKTDGTLKATRNRSAPKLNATVEAVTQLLQAFRTPLSTQVLLEYIDQAALELEENGLNVLSARLSNSKKFKARRGVGWWFIDRPWPDENGAPAGAPDASEAHTSLNSNPKDPSAAE